MKLEKVIETLSAIELHRDENSIVPKLGTQFELDEKGPPDNFRDLSVYPTESEILGERRFVRPNMVDGPYTNLDHYLDVQYRLLREDFVNPLRSGIRSIRSGDDFRYEDVRVYKRIQFLRREAANENYCVRLKFCFGKGVSTSGRKESKKFMHGSLLCFTEDNFITTYFGQIVRNDNRNVRGELVVEFNGTEPHLNFNQDYLMVECSVYFGPYFHVLTSLRDIHEDDLAMKDYIVNVKPARILPKYLHRLEVYEIDGKQFAISDLENETRNVYGFNDSQMTAFKAALTSEFTIIQGPPGTGKTFLALKIAKTLVENYESWWNFTPMLVICYTNHALDQFLEGLLNITEKIVRIGNQSKNEFLRKINLKVLRKQRRSNRKFCRREVYSASKNFRNITTEIEIIEQNRGIVFSRCFEDIVRGYDGSFFIAVDGENFAKWLLEGYQEPESRRGADGMVESSAATKESVLLKSLLQSHRFRESTFVITLKDIEKRIGELECRLRSLERDLDSTEWNIFFGGYPFDEIQNTREFMIELEKLYKYLEKRLEEVNVALKNQLICNRLKISNFTSLNHDDRWAMYTSWLYSYKQHLQQRAAASIRSYQQAYKEYEKHRMSADVSLLRDAFVIGMTTTSAARLKPVLKKLRCPIIIVEEAAEVLEAHIVAALTQHCRHIILIGDHKQLRPSTADYTISKGYRLGISLFERMVNNGMECHTLNIQHRMRPEFSRLISPTIYPNLKDHESVYNRPPINGVQSCIHFIDHEHMEDNCSNTPSKKNSYEVGFVVALARHLVLNGYKSEQVTILTAYLGQVTEMLKRRDRCAVIRNIRITSIDNFQGEQSDIIILSLVRSNTARKIGFLASENRVCVAMSRARLGFYIIGNMTFLCDKSKMWSNIKNCLEAQNALGQYLTLRCEIHENVTTDVGNGEDFQRVVHGGCTRICRAKLSCGHLCASQCHVLDREHDEYQCFEPCLRKLCDSDDHLCLKKCYEECGSCFYAIPRQLNCGHELKLECCIDIRSYKCRELLTTRLSCGHVVEYNCCVDVNTLQCPYPCESIINTCGHRCTRSCHTAHDPDHIEYKCPRKCMKPRSGCTAVISPISHPCPKMCHEHCAPCDIPVLKRRSNCLHTDVVACNIDVNSVKCRKPCAIQLNCGHCCRKKCAEPCEPTSCLIKVKKILQVCGHKVATPCNQEPSRYRCSKRCPLKLACGHPCTKRCNQVCTPQCEVLVNIRRDIAPASTSYTMQMKCYQMILD